MIRGRVAILVAQMAIGGAVISAQEFGEPRQNPNDRNQAADRSAACITDDCQLWRNQVAAWAGQVADGKRGFVAALRHLLEALEGTHGEEERDIRFGLDRLAAALAEWDVAIQTYRTFLTQVAGDAGVRLAIGATYLDRGKADDALKEFGSASRYDPWRLDVHVFQGLAYDVLGRSGDAARAFRRASSLEPHSSASLYALAQQLIRLADWDEASITLRKFHEIARKKLATPDHGQSAGSPFFRVGLLHEVAGVAPIFPPALYARGFALLTRGAYEEALVEFRQAATRDSLGNHADLSHHHLVLGRAALKERHLRTALEHLQKAIQEVPGHSETHRLLGILYRADEQYDRSIEHFRAAIDFNPKDERSRLALAAVLATTGRTGEAEGRLKETIQAVPESGQAHYSLGGLYRSLARYPEALREFETAAEYNPIVGQDHLYETIGTLYLREADFDGAAQAYRKRLEINPNNADAHRSLGETYVQLGRQEEALAEFAAALLIDPLDAQAHATRARLYLQTARYAEAESAARRAVSLAPGHRSAQYALGSSLMRLGRTEEGTAALQVFERMQATDMAADHREWELKLIKQAARERIERGDYDHATALLQQAVAYAPGLPSSYVNLGLILMRERRYKEAVGNFNKALELGPGPEVHRHLAEAYEALGDTEQSRRQAAIYDRAKEDRFRRASGSP